MPFKAVVEGIVQVTPGGCSGSCVELRHWIPSGLSVSSQYPIHVNVQPKHKSNVNDRVIKVR
jgi:hypothetical protein